MLRRCRRRWRGNTANSDEWYAARKQLGFLFQERKFSGWLSADDFVLRQIVLCSCGWHTFEARCFEEKQLRLKHVDYAQRKLIKSLTFFSLDFSKLFIAAELKCCLPSNSAPIRWLESLRQNSWQGIFWSKLFFPPRELQSRCKILFEIRKRNEKTFALWLRDGVVWWMMEMTEV